MVVVMYPLRGEASDIVVCCVFGDRIAGVDGDYVPDETRASLDRASTE